MNILMGPVFFAVTAYQFEFFNYSVIEESKTGLNKLNYFKKDQFNLQFKIVFFASAN